MEIGHMTLDHEIGVRIPASQLASFKELPMENPSIYKVLYFLIVRQM